MAEWSKAQHWKCCVGASLPWVQIPLSPPFFVSELSHLNSVSGFTMSSDMVPYRMIRQIPLSPPFFVPELSLLNSVPGFTMSSDMVPYRMIRQIPLSPPFFLSKNGERSRKASLHAATAAFHSKGTAFSSHLHQTPEALLACPP